MTGAVGLEGGLVGEATRAGRRGGTPRVVCRCATATTRLLTAAAAEAAATAAVSTADLVDLRGRVAQRGADLVDLQLHDSALLAFLRLEGTLAQPSGDEHSRTTGERLGHVLGDLTPHVAPQEQRFAVLPLAGLAVEGAGRGGDREGRHRGTALGEAEFGVGGQVPDHRDRRLASHVLGAP